jgi:riboflavin kinase
MAAHLRTVIPGGIVTLAAATALGAGDEPVEQFEGTVLSGVNEGAFFVGLGWVRDAVRRITGFDPYPGTLNVRLADTGALVRWRELRTRAGAPLAPTDPGACGGRLLPALVESQIPAAVVIPDVTRYGDEVLELIAPVRLRSALRLRDGDRVRLTIESAGPGSAKERSGR